jgi:hypothetical protein
LIALNVEIFFLKADPKRPNAKFNKKNPTWEVQGRTYSKEQAEEWKKLGLGVKRIAPEEDDVKPYWRINLKKKSAKEDGEPASFVKVVNGQLQDIDPNTVGNGSIAHIRVFQYEYDKKEGGKGTASVLMGLQIVKHIVYVPKARDDDFGEEETETIAPDDHDEADEAPFEADKPATPSPSPKVTKPADNLPAADF